MSKIAIVTDSNSGITQKQGEAHGIYVIPMPFTINGDNYFEDINLTQEDFYKLQGEDADIFTSQPIIGDILDLWDKLLTEYDEIIHIPMSSSLSGSCSTAITLAEDYDGKVQIVDNQRISVTQRESVLEAIELAKMGKSAKEIKEMADELVDYAVEKGTPVIEKTANAAREKAIEVTKEVLAKLEDK